MENFTPTFSYKLIYVFAIDSPDHEGLLKVGDTTIHTNIPYNRLVNNSDELNSAARLRIKQYTQTAAIKTKLLHTELAVCEKKNNDGSIKLKAFRDYDVRTILINSGKTPIEFDFLSRKSEWYKIDLNTAQNAIRAVKEGRKSLYSQEITTDKTPILFRPNQELAINSTIKQFKNGNNMLWNAKMRFGKTLTALEVVKRMPEILNKTVILTHRPVVSDGWFEDFNKIFYETDNKYLFGSKTKGESIDNLIKRNNPFVYFASIQDLRGSSLVGGKFEKNDKIFSVAWDLVIIDEAHEGTLTELGNNVLTEITKNNEKTKILKLSGTPFNIIENYKEDEIFTWDYVMEQKAKEEWDVTYYGKPNPYDELPQMQIYTYNLKTLVSKSDKYVDIEDKAFNFREFFRVWTGNSKIDKKALPSENLVGKFINEKDVLSFLNLMTKEDGESNYPYSTSEYREYFKHSLWMVPGVKEAKALKALMETHPIFGSGQFNIVNVAGEDDEEDSKDALKNVRTAISKVEENGGYTITLSCGKLTTGVTVPEWSAVFMLSGSYSTSASSYLQTIFRVQSPGNIDGKIKEKCYVFDFAPDRTLKMVAEARQLSIKPGAIVDKAMMGEFLNFCPVIAIDGSSMKEYDVGTMLQELKKSYAEKVLRNGFDDRKLYNDHLLRAEGIDFNEFEDLRKIIGASKQTKKAEKIDVNVSGLTKEEREQLESIEKKPKRELSEEEKQLIQKKNEAISNRDKAISTLRGISIRIPLLIYGANISINKDITIDSLTEIVDDLSWKEFMPNGLTKDHFNKYKKYYDPEIFIAAGRQIRASVLSADDLEPEERIEKLTKIFSTFKNPDKETVLTPWRVVNMHMGDTLGGYNFFNEDYSETINKPRLIINGKETKETLLNKNANLLEIHSKTGLYPLYLTYSLYKTKLDNDKISLKDYWRETVENNMFIICKTEMAKFITKRTLVGYKDIKPNILVIENIVDMMKNDKNTLLSQISNASTWKIKKNGKLQEGKMKFDAIVGNPPYQEQGGSGGNNDSPLYQFFANISNQLDAEYSSLIMPARWFSAGRENLLGEFRRNFLNDNRIKTLTTYFDGGEVFPNVEIKGGICYYLLDKTKTNELCEYTLIKDGKKTASNIKLNEFDIFIRDPFVSKIVSKVVNQNNTKLTVSSIISSDTPFGISSNVRNSKKNKIEVYANSTNEHNTLLFHIENNKRKIEYVSKSDIIKNAKDIPYDKVFVPGSGGSGNDSIVIGVPELAPKNSVCSQSYLYAKFDNSFEAQSFYKYLKTRFLRILVMAIKITQSAPNRVYKFVPLQNFTEKADIDWTKTISEIDQQLYKKYKFTQEEIDYIEENIKPME